MKYVKTNVYLKKQVPMSLLYSRMIAKNNFPFSNQISRNELVF